ncbi:MAG: hypothetical protein ACFFEV_09395, partial [Candidatus Thorarchaeota archaeon]
MKRIRLFFIICLLGLLFVDVVDSKSYSSEGVSVNDIDLSIEEVELLNDPNLAEPQVIVHEGSLSEFSSLYEPPTGGSNNSLLHLTWSHDNETPLDFKSESERDYNLPDCNDFIYIEQEFEWTLNRIPGAVDYGATTSITTTGDFGLSSDFFEWYIWLIDSSDNFIEIYQS